MELLTVGHGTLDADAFTALLAGAEVAAVVDVRRFPGSRRHPHFGAEPLAASLDAAGIAYRHEPDLGGRRTGRPASPHVGLRHPSFRAYADHMATPEFRDALERALAEAAVRRTAVLCSESLWWRCHRRLVADAASLLSGVDVRHLRHDGRLDAHVPTDVVRREGDRLVYDGGAPPLPLEG